MWNDRAMSDLATGIVTGLLPLIGVGIGTAATLVVQRSSERASRGRFVAESRRTYQDEIKAALMTYFETAQVLQGQLDNRERGAEFNELKPLIERVWLTEKALEIVCSDELATCLIAHARALHDVVRDGRTHLDWWQHCAEPQAALIAQAKRDLQPQLTY
jgi:hypothetical protein